MARLTKREQRLLKAAEKIAGWIAPGRGMHSFYSEDILEFFAALCEYNAKKWRVWRDNAQRELDRGEKSRADTR